MSELQKSLWEHIPEKKWMDFREARNFVRNLGLSEINQWAVYIAGNDESLVPLPGDIPADPDIHYRYSGWKGWEDWLGIDPSKKNTDKEIHNLWDIKYTDRWLSFIEARKISWGYGFEYKEEWEMFASGKFPGRTPIPDNIPANPDVIYRFTGWKSWKDWLVPAENWKEYSSFSNAREFVRSLRLKDIVEWRNYMLSGNNLHGSYNIILPEKPDLEYQDKGWKEWNDWLGKEIKFRDYHTTRSFVVSLKLKNRNEWEEYCNNRLYSKNPKPENIFSYPDLAYNNEGWKGWDHWLGIGQIKEDQAIPDSDFSMKECRCRGKISNCPECDGKGYI